MTEQDQPSRSRMRRTGRLEAFSDGVFAIAITLLVLEISVPAGSEDHLLDAVLDQWPSYLAYVVSFATIGALWLAHTGVTEYLDHADVWLLRLNLSLLMVVSFLPFPTRLLAENVTHEDAAKVATTIYGISLLATAALLSGVWRYAVGAGLVRPEADDDEVKVLTERLTPGLAGYAVMIAIGLLVPVVAVVGYLVIAVYYLLPIPALARRGRRRHR